MMLRGQKVPSNIEKSGDSILFSLEEFSQQIDNLLGTMGKYSSVGVATVIHTSDLCALDVSEAAFALEDDGMVPDADLVFDFDLGRLASAVHELLGKSA